MQFGKLTLDDIGKFGALCVGATVAYFVIHTTGYFKIIGREFIGLYLDSNLFSGILYAAPGVFAILSLSVYAYYWIHRLLGRYLSDHEITNMFLFYDKFLLIPVVLVLIFVDDDWLFIETAVWILVAFVACGIVYFQYRIIEDVNYINLIFSLIAVYQMIYIMGKESALLDVRRISPRYYVYANDKTYINAIILKSTGNCLIMRWGKEVIFYPTDQIQKVSRSDPAVKE